MPSSTQHRLGLVLNTLSQSNRIIPAMHTREALTKTEDADQVEDSVRQARQQYLNQITGLHGEARRNGYEDGMALATQKTLQTLHAAERVYHDAEQDLVALVLTALEKIAGDLPAEALTPNIVLKTLRELRGHSGQLIVRVHPDMTSTMSEHLDAWNDESTTALKLEIVGDDSMALLDCRLDCGDCVIEAGLPVQLRALQRTLQNIVGHADDHHT